MTASLNVRNAVTALVIAGLALLPLYSSISGNVFVLTLFTRIVIFALAAVSLNLIMGYGGMMSFGHAAYLGIGGYAVGILAFEGIGSGFIQWPVALAASALFALVIALPLGFVLFRGQRAKVNEGIGVVDDQRRTRRDELRSRLRGTNDNYYEAADDKPDPDSGGRDSAGGDSASGGAAGSTR